MGEADCSGADLSFTRLRTDYCSSFQGGSQGWSLRPQAPAGWGGNSSRASPGQALAGGRDTGGRHEGCGLELPGEAWVLNLLDWTALPVLGRQGDTLVNGSLMEAHGPTWGALEATEGRTTY